MTSRIAATSLALAAICALDVSAQTVDQLVANRALLNAELERCKQLAMASVDDARCKIANAAENKRFFGGGTHYSTSVPYMTPGSKIPNTSPQAPPSSKPHDGQ